MKTRIVYNGRINTIDILFFKVNDKMDKMGRTDFNFIIYITDVKRTLAEAWK